MTHKQIFWIGAGTLLIVGGVFIHIQLARILATKTVDEQKMLAGRALMIRAAEAVVLLLGVGLVVAGLLAGQR